MNRGVVSTGTLVINMVVNRYTAAQLGNLVATVLAR
jgi:hypothetical protein